MVVCGNHTVCSSAAAESAKSAQRPINEKKEASHVLSKEEQLYLWQVSLLLPGPFLSRDTTTTIPSEPTKYFRPQSEEK